MAMMKINWATGRMEAVEFPELKRGQILHCWSGMCGSHYEKAVLIATTKDAFGIHYKAVALEDHHYIHPTAPEVFERAGKIGCFYKNGEVIPEEETAKYEMLALQRQQRIAAEQEQKRIETEKLRGCRESVYGRSSRQRKWVPWKFWADRWRSLPEDGFRSWGRKKLRHRCWYCRCCKFSWWLPLF